LSTSWKWPEEPLEYQKLRFVLTMLPFMSLKFNPGVESELCNRNKKYRKPMRYLETVSEAVAAMDAVPDQVYGAQIEKLIFNRDSLASTFREMYRAWESFCIDDFERLLPRLHLAQPLAIRKAFLDDRNRAWLPKIRDALSAERPMLIVVGAAHLFGKGGLLALLQSSGHHLTSIA